MIMKSALWPGHNYSIIGKSFSTYCNVLIVFSVLLSKAKKLNIYLQLYLHMKTKQYIYFLPFVICWTDTLQRGETI